MNLHNATGVLTRHVSAAVDQPGKWHPWAGYTGLGKWVSASFGSKKKWVRFPRPVLVGSKRNCYQDSRFDSCLETIAFLDALR